jgi:nucleoside diphosphate kinase
MLSRTGLFIIAIKVHRMTVAQAKEFYGPVREVLREKMAEAAGDQARAILAEHLEVSLPGKIAPSLGKLLAPHVAEERFNRLIKFMTGRRLDETAKEEETAPGLEKIVAVVYQGVDAVAKIRNVLGPTDPSQAPPGTIRRELGESIMVNAAHASDSAANAKREMKIINIEENRLRRLVEEFYNCKL